MFYPDGLNTADTMPEIAPASSTDPKYWKQSDPGMNNATHMTADFLNEFMMEIVNLLLGLSVTPTKGTCNQIAGAIVPRLTVDGAFSDSLKAVFMGGSSYGFYTSPVWGSGELPLGARATAFQFNGLAGFEVAGTTVINADRDVAARNVSASGTLGVTGATNLSTLNASGLATLAGGMKTVTPTVETAAWSSGDTRWNVEMNQVGGEIIIPFSTHNLAGSSAEVQKIRVVNSKVNSDSRVHAFLSGEANLTNGFPQTVTIIGSGYFDVQVLNIGTGTMDVNHFLYFDVVNPA